ncbi:MAG TPA: L-threonylcarbamoyladenylate synthase [Demequina sp.]|nr:L-threonylcarbamoyladenylate synthase [Demequina sp.]
MILSYLDEPAAALDAAVRALEKGGLVVLPTDTVYGIAADAFSPTAVGRLLAAKGRGRQMPPPVLVANPGMVNALAVDVSHDARALLQAFWPGALTIILRSQPSLAWDLGETSGTVALRMPDNEGALALLQRYGPLAVTSANLTGQPPAQDAQAAEAYFGANVAVYVDAGPTPGPTASTIVDATGPVMRIVRAGVLTRAQLAEVVPALAEEGAEPGAGDDSGGDAEPGSDDSPGAEGA